MTDPTSLLLGAFILALLAALTTANVILTAIGVYVTFIRDRLPADPAPSAKEVPDDEKPGCYAYTDEQKASFEAMRWDEAERAAAMADRLAG